MKNGSFTTAAKSSGRHAGPYFTCVEAADLHSAIQIDGDADIERQGEDQ